MNPKLAVVLKEIQFNSPFRRYFFPRYTYNFTVPQLIFLCECIGETRGVGGAIAEVGCSKGYTTLFLNKYMDAEGIEKHYFALDTFSGFPAEDVSVEIADRGKTAGIFQAAGFEINKQKWFDGAMQDAGITRVETMQADVNAFDLTRLAPLSFVLLDVDLYRPIKKALPELYEALAPGGMMVVDDCDTEDAVWDGAAQAYMEYMAGMGREPEVVLRKLGIVRKPA